MGKQKNKPRSEKGTLAFSVTADDCEWQYMRPSGNGGQGMQKTSSKVRVRHPESGAEGQASDTRSQLQNRRLAWRRMVDSPLFKGWIALKLSDGPTPEERVAKDMEPQNLRVEVKKDGNWVDEEAVRV